VDSQRIKLEATSFLMISLMLGLQRLEETALFLTMEMRYLTAVDIATRKFIIFIYLFNRGASRRSIIE
jgi:hypothetical protein